MVLYTKTLAYIWWIHQNQFNFPSSLLEVLESFFPNKSDMQDGER